MAVVSEGPFFRSDKKSVAFREWLDDVGAEVEPLPDDAFKGQRHFAKLRCVRGWLRLPKKELPIHGKAPLLSLSSDLFRGIMGYGAATCIL